ncbi:hypothetical protein [Enterovirga rhinocerotis]|uniref:Ribbon-helix-helix CopG family protein n=1 Tax=Enterovirga rhinocerotis TaxID=1339210 RepID=A0A4R7C646_9HYPH|nr:hypothetical protein [Enterovirga rhinocerotis]TDR94044.1 hypothetical protein EV668_1315 [Enterovirga rhinocerotis]
MTTPIDDAPKSRGRPVTTGTGTMLGVRLLPDLLASLDAHIAAQPDPKPTRPEAIRRVLADRFEKRGRKAAPAAASPAVAEKAARARTKAANAADVALGQIEAPADVKATRRRALVEKPAMVAKARGKSRLATKRTGS